MCRSIHIHVSEHMWVWAATSGIQREVGEILAFQFILLKAMKTLLLRWFANGFSTAESRKSLNVKTGFSIAGQSKAIEVLDDYQIIFQVYLIFNRLKVEIMCHLCMHGRQSEEQGLQKCSFQKLHILWQSPWSYHLHESTVMENAFEKLVLFSVDKTTSHEKEKIWFKHLPNN